MKNTIQQNNPKTPVLSVIFLLFFLGISQWGIAQDPLVVEEGKVSVNGTLNATALETKTINGNPNFTGETTFSNNVKVQKLQIGNWVITEENGQLVFTNGNQIMLLTPLAIGDKYGGGIVVHLNGNGHGLVAALADQGKADWDQGMALCKNYRGGGYNDWRLPNKSELNLLYKNLFKANLGEFAPETYWSSEPFALTPWQQNFKNGAQLFSLKSFEFRVRAVRSF